MGFALFSVSWKMKRRVGAFRGDRFGMGRGMGSRNGTATRCDAAVKGDRLLSVAPATRVSPLLARGVQVPTAASE
jgi:hypothetical protein